MLEERRIAQQARTPGFTRMHRKPRGFQGKWDPTGDWAPLLRPRFIPASINRRTGKPHLHTRAKLRQLAKAA
jgi:hypothetical protein